MRILALVFLVACSGKQTEPSNKVESTPGPTTPVPDNAMTCKADGDCPAQLSCGPCESGTVLTHDNVHPECVVNPCHAALQTRCNAGVCVVK